MRIVLVVQSFPKLSETFIFRKVTGLLDRGWDVRVVCNRSESEEWKHFSTTLSSSRRVDVHRGGAEYAEKKSQEEISSASSASPQSESLRSRVHKGLPHTPHWLAGLLLPVAVIQCLILNFTGTFRYLKSGWGLFRFDIFRKLYTDRPIICLKPDVVHFEFGALAVGRMYLKELLGSRIVVSFRGYDVNFSGLDVERPARRTDRISRFAPDVSDSENRVTEQRVERNSSFAPDGSDAENRLTVQDAQKISRFAPIGSDAGYYREVWDKADVIHLLGDDLWQRAQARGCLPAKRHVLIPPAIDSGLYNPGDRRHQGVAGTTGRPVRILSVGRLEWKKGYEYAMRAVRRLVEKGLRVEYQIVGDGAYLEALTFARYEMGLEEVVDFTGALSPDIVRDKMMWADLLLHAAVSEGFCNAVMEAQAMMLPVVCSDADGLPENVADGETGFVVARRNPDALAEKIEVLARDAELRQRMGVAGRERVRRCFRIENQIAAFEEMYRNVERLSGANLRSAHSPLWVGMRVSERGSRRGV